MSDITKIKARIVTGNRPNAGTDGNVYLGLCGREFLLDSSADDHERNDARTYVLGEIVPGETAVNNAAFNDPRVHYLLHSEGLDKSPAYIRFDPLGGSPDWNLEEVTVTVWSHATYLATYSALGGGNHLWLGSGMGKYCYLKRS